MVARYKQYSEYKGSGIEWLGVIPKTWSVSKVAYVFSMNNAGSVIDKNHWTPGGIEILYTCQRTPIRSDFKNFPLNKRTTENDILLTRNGTPYIHLPEANSIYSNVVQRLTLKYSFHRKFMSYALINSSKYLQGYGVSIESFNFETWKSLKFPLPSKSEQIKIVNFLDHETAKIDALIFKQQKLIELLKEKRKATISHAVTNGLNPDAQIKASGIGWLGEVPKHWGMGKIGFYAKVTNGATPNRDNLEFWSEGTIPWLNSGKVNDKSIESADQFITPKAKYETSVAVVKPNDLLVAITGEGQTRGRVAICCMNATINQHLACVSLFSPKVNHVYLYFYLKNAYETLRIESDGAGATKGAITCVQLTKFPLIIPPMAEQIAIIEVIKRKLNTFDILLKKAEYQIKILTERKSVLISSAVTGKIDTRDWQSNTKEKSNA